MLVCSSGLEYSRILPRFGGPFRLVEREFCYSGTGFGVKTPENSLQRGIQYNGFATAGCDCTRVAKMLEHAWLVHSTRHILGLGPQLDPMWDAKGGNCI